MLVQNGEVCSVDASVCSSFFEWLAIGNLNTTSTKSTSLAVCVMMDGIFAAFQQDCSDSSSELSPYVQVWDQ